MPFLSTCRYKALLDTLPRVRGAGIHLRLLFVYRLFLVIVKRAAIAHSCVNLFLSESIFKFQCGVVLVAILCYYRGNRLRDPGFTRVLFIYRRQLKKNGIITLKLINR